MKREQIAAQLYTLRDHLKTPDDIKASLKKVADIGYQSVQLSGMGPIDEADLVALCKDLGLVICATHEGSAEIVEHPERVVERLQKLGCRYTAYPYPHVDLDSADAARALAAQLDASGKVLADAGLGLGYHNHAIEFRRFEGATVLDILYDQTDPKHLLGEIDTYWVQAGGGDPVAWCRKLGGRMPFVHLKDFGVPQDADKGVFCEVGSGNLDWREIIAALREGGCEWYIVEQDVCPGDPFDSLKQSFDYLVETFC